MEIQFRQPGRLYLYGFSILDKNTSLGVLTMNIIGFFVLSTSNAEFVQFVKAHPLMRDFWANCPNAAWMREAMLRLYDHVDWVTRDHFFHQYHKEYWKLLRVIKQQNALRNASDEERDAILQRDVETPNQFQQDLMKQVESNQMAEREANYKSWLGADCWIIHFLQEAIGSSNRRTMIVDGIGIHFDKVQALGRRLTPEEATEIEREVEILKKEKERQVLKEQADAFREILGNPF